MALVNILLTIMEKSSEGGATMEDLKIAYYKVSGNPLQKNIYRSIRRLSMLFNSMRKVGERVVT